MEPNELLKKGVPLFILLAAGCGTPAPFPLLGQAEQCIRVAQAQSDQGGGAALLSHAKDNLGSAQRQSEEIDAKHYAHLALQQCRTARSMFAADQSEKRLASLETTRVHLELGLRTLMAQAAERDEQQFASRLAVGHGGKKEGVAIPMGKELFPRAAPGLSADTGPLMEEIVGFLLRHRQWNITVANAATARARRGAASVRHALVARGVRPERIRMQSDPGQGFVSLLINRPR